MSESALDRERRAVHAVIDAILNPGPRPGYHARVKAEVWKIWPTLGRALDELVAAFREESTR